ncbi:MAG: hypothetical protein EYC70_00065 [Planctomycetota bacterium]|nr:MAG: hypothetical protein EYC70_00065 [Planctomycetota bacterium]
MRTQRTNRVLDAELLEKAVRISGERTYSAAVNRALAEFVRWSNAARIVEFLGSGAWEGDLSEMPGENTPASICEITYRRARASLLDFPRVESPSSRTVFLEADCLIAACVLHNGRAILQIDRDFGTLARVSALQVRATLP